ncbi:MAG: ABC transporter permease [Bacteroidetes bacterium]|nr:ABC transporter permease [Bacteroidota bacterium]
MTNLEIDEEKWDQIILPKARLFDINLKELWRYRDLILLFVKRDFSAQFKQTVLGPLWHVIQPVFTTIMFLFIFSKVAKIPTDGINPILFYMSGITIWNYFSLSLTATSNTFVSNANIFGKVYFPRLVLPISTIISNIIKFAIQFGLLLIVMIYFGIKNKEFYLSFSWLLVPVLVLLMAGLGLGLGIIISSLTTKYRDLTVLITFGVQLLMYATPVAYPMSYLRGTSMGNIIAWNPLSPVIEGFRYSIFGVGEFDVNGLIYSTLFTVIILITGIIVFNRVEKNFMDTV